MYDVAIVGGGPAGSTAGSLLKKYNPELKVLILEREKFPRDHVGESQLPGISTILDEMGCWDKVEAANFPIKIGATYRWGKTPELWDFEFTPAEKFVDEPRPAKYQGQRKLTAFQVDRAVYDKILLDHAASLGCEVREECKVSKILRTGDKVDGFQLEDGSVIEARYYMDASGHGGLMRRALGIGVNIPTALQNIAVWDYWQNAEWAVEIGVGGTRVQVMSLGYGWIWFIPLSPTRTSIGLIVPASYYKSSGLKFSELYHRAIHEDERIQGLIANATCEGKMDTTTDWSFLADRIVGENWFLIGESAGFADPVLAAGLTIAHNSAREAAFTVLELDRGDYPAEYLKTEYQARQVRRVTNHIRFADYWYSANEQFSELKEFTKQIAADNGLDLSPEKAWAWLAQGGFVNDSPLVGVAGFSVGQVKAIHGLITDFAPESVLSRTNVFKLKLDGAKWEERLSYADGRIYKHPCYVRENNVLPLAGVFWVILEQLQRSPKLADLLNLLAKMAADKGQDEEFIRTYVLGLPEALEGMISDGWVEASYDPTAPLVAPPKVYTGVERNTDAVSS